MVSKVEFLPGLSLMVVTVAAAGCLRPTRDAPVEAGRVWATYQGAPGRDAYAAEPVPSDSPDVVWEADAGRGLAAPPVLLGPVLLAATTNRMVMTLSTETGEVFWEHRKSGGFSVPPVADGDRVYVATSEVDGRVYALRPRDGRERWEKQYGGVGVPLVVEGGRLYLATEAGILAALRPEDGNRIWEVRLPAPPAAGPLPVGDRILVATIRDSLHVVQAADGSPGAALSLEGQASASPALAGRTAVFPLEGGEVVGVDVEELTEAWRFRTDGTVRAAPAVGADGTVYLLDETGSVWRRQPGGEPERLAELGGTATASLTLGQNALVAGFLDGRVVALDPAEGRVLWTHRVQDSVTTPVVLQDGHVFVALRRGAVVKLR